MARAIVVSWDGEESAFGFAKVEREKLYGRKRRVVVDEQSRPCQAAWLTADGSALVPSGGTAHVWTDEQWNAAETEERLAVDEQGTALEAKASTLGVAQAAEIVDAARVLEHVTVSVYQLLPESISPKLAEVLASGAILEIPFRYREGYDEDAMFVLRNEEGLFALVGRPAGFEFLEREQAPLALDGGAAEADELSDDLDFSMM